MCTAIESAEREHMPIIAVNGSPRATGATARLIQEVLTGCEEVGAETKLFQLGEMNVAPCDGCMRCKATAKCVVKDDMQQIYDAINTAEVPKGLVLGSPIYFDHITAQLKAFLDRLYCYTYTELGQKMFPKGFRSVLVTTFDADPITSYDSVLEWLKGRLGYYHEIETIAMLALDKATGHPPEKRGDILRTAREAGRKLAGGE